MTSKLKQVRLALINEGSWIRVRDVRRWMIWTLVLLLTFPGCLCGLLCLGEDHEENHSHQDGPSLSHYCDTHEKHHCCFHSGELNLNSIVSEGQLDSPQRLEHFISTKLLSAGNCYSLNTFRPPPPFHLRISTGREILKLCHRLII